MDVTLDLVGETGQSGPKGDAGPPGPKGDSGLGARGQTGLPFSYHHLEILVVTGTVPTGFMFEHHCQTNSCEITNQIICADLTP